MIMSFDVQSLRHFDSAETAARYVADEIIKACAEATQKRGEFHWVLAGGSTPELCYRLLRDADMDWEKAHVWFGDERALPTGNPERNETMARSALLDHVNIPANQIHSIDFSGGTETAAANYTKALKNIKIFDLVMLGMGEDGHTASLFPNNPVLINHALAVPVFDSPKPPVERVSLSFKALNNHRTCFILATGAAKKDILKEIIQGADLPITHVNHATWVVD